MPDLARLAESLGVPLTPDQLRGFREYTRLLLEANRRMNLTALRDEGALLRHYHLDALALLPVIARAVGMPADDLRKQAWRAVDVGTGGGAPAIPLAIAWPALHYTLVESIAKKARFLEDVAQALNLAVTVINARAEDVGRDPAHRERYDLVTARAVAVLPALVELTLPFVRVGGLAVYPKGPRALEETETATYAIQTLGGKLLGIEKLKIPGVEEDRFAVVVQKVGHTPEKYPRRPGMPVKRPLLPR